MSTTTPRGKHSPGRIRGPTNTSPDLTISSTSIPRGPAGAATRHGCQRNAAKRRKFRSVVNESRTYRKFGMGFTRMGWSEPAAVGHGCRSQSTDPETEAATRNRVGDICPEPRSLREEGTRWRGERTRGASKRVCTTVRPPVVCSSLTHRPRLARPGSSGVPPRSRLSFERRPRVDAGPIASAAAEARPIRDSHLAARFPIVEQAARRSASPNRQPLNARSGLVARSRQRVPDRAPRSTDGPVADSHGR